jgi:hypothetical protein
MTVTKQDAECFIFKAKQAAARLKWLMFCADTTADGLAYAMQRYCVYDEAVTFYSALMQWLNDGIIDAQHAYNCAFERSQKVMFTTAA